MNIFDQMKEHGHEQIIFCYDSVSGLKAIIGIHDTTLGPALGGTRIWDYETEKEALIDVLRLSKGMTYKNAVAGLNLGGGKTVIMGDPGKIKSEELFRAFGRYIEGLGGRYITGEDMNATTKDMGIINEETDHVVGLEGKGGNPAPVTAFGVFKGILAAVEEAFGTIDLTGKTIAVQGVGAVGYHLCKHLHEAGANLIVSDIKKTNTDRAVKDFGATEVTPEKIYETDCDVFAPCAMGAIINDYTIEQLKCKVIAGSANNQLAENRHGEMLKKKGIVYAPDFVINGAGVMNAYEEMKGYNAERAIARAARVYDNVKKVFEIAKRDNIPTYRAADRMAEERIKKIWQITKILNNK